MWIMLMTAAWASDAVVARAWNALEMEMYPEAVEAAEQALQNDKLSKNHRAMVLYVAAKSRSAVGDTSEAYEHAQACVAAGGKEAAECAGLALQLSLPVGIALFNDGMRGDRIALEQSVSTLATWLSKNPGSFTALHLQGQALAELGRPAEAVLPLETANKVGDRGEEHAQALIKLISVRIELGQLDPAMHDLAAGRGISPKLLVVPQLTLARALESAGRHEEAVIRYEEAAKGDPENAIARHALGIALVNGTQRAKDNDEAKRYLERGRVELEAALALTPDNQDLRAALIKVVTALGDEAAAQALSEAAVPAP